MYVKKRMSLLLFAALAMVLFTACGRWDFSREAAKAANEAQGANPVVTFDTSRALTDALRDAAAENVQPTDIETALKADDTLAELLAGRSVLDVRFAAGDQSADDAAAAIAAQFGRLTGRKPEAFIAMVKADNGYFYAAVVTYRTGSSGSGSGSGTGSDDGTGGTTTDPNPDDGDEDDDPVVTEKYTITVTCGTNGNVMHNGKSVSGKVEIKVGTSGTFTFAPDATYEIDAVTVDNKKVENPGASYTFDDGEDHTINVTFKKSAIIGLTVETIEGTFKDEYWVGDKAQTGEKFDPAGLKVSATYSDNNKEDVTDDCTFTIDNKEDYTFTSEDAAIGSKQVVIKHPASGKTATVTVSVCQVRMVIYENNVTLHNDGTFSPVGMIITTMYYKNNSYTQGPSIEITQNMIDNGEVTFKYEGRVIGQYKYRIYYRSLNDVAYVKVK